MPKYFAALSPEPEPVLPTLAPIPIPTRLTAHGALRASRRIRLVFDFLASELAQP